MAPLRSKARKSTDSTSTTTSYAGTRKPSPSTRIVMTKAGSPVARTPKRSPVRRKAALTAGQKQALIDNLQLEVTERARKLRAQYSLQVHGLRTRLEIRVNRIPMALRKANIGDLLAKYAAEEAATVALSEAEANKKGQKAADEIAAHLHAPKGVGKDIDSHENYSPARGKKRLSDEISCDVDKENESHPDLALPKKRTKAAAPAAGVPARTTSRAKPTTVSQVLSPKSSNAMAKNMQRPAPRTQTTPGKSLLARPVAASPLKPTVPSNSSAAAAPTIAATGVLAGIVEKLKSTRSAAARKISPTRAPAVPPAAATRGKRALAQPTAPAPAKAVGRTRAESNGSRSSESTTGTVVMKIKPKGKVSAAVQKVEREVKAKAAPVGRTAAATTAVKKVAAGKAAASVGTVAAQVSADGRRVLRKRK